MGACARSVPPKRCFAAPFWSASTESRSNAYAWTTAPSVSSCANLQASVRRALQPANVGTENPSRDAPLRAANDDDADRVVRLDRDRGLYVSGDARNDDRARSRRH